MLTIVENPFDIEQDIDEIKEKLQNNVTAAAAAMIQSYLEEQNNIPLNIGVTGESGSGKSTFVNVIRGLNSKDDGAAPTGCVETTMEVKSYPHPNYPNVIFWDLPGVGTTNFPADKYLKHVGFERFDFFIIVSADRFRENDVKLALEIKRMKKKFYFVRSKIDHNLRDERDDQGSEFNEKQTLDRIRTNCIQGLQKQGLEDTNVFLVSSRKLHLFDFPLLQQTLERELPAHKRDALLFAMPNINLEIIQKKKEAFQAQIKYFASVSALIASVPVPGLSVAADAAMMATTVAKYQVTFGLDSESLKTLALTAHVSFDDLKAVITSPLAAQKITTELIIKLLYFSVSETVLMAAEEGARFIPFFGIPVAMSVSFTFTYRALNMFLDMLADDAQRVFRRALGLDTSV
ncbi:interferon-inducible GTPase 5-like [Anabas testudineus]|nr:interferon-inducible GTPase 5-like [Anabas testudineus]